MFPIILTAVLTAAIIFYILTAGRDWFLSSGWILISGLLGSFGITALATITGVFFSAPMSLDSFTVGSVLGMIAVCATILIYTGRRDKEKK